MSIEKTKEQIEALDPTWISSSESHRETYTATHPEIQNGRTTMQNRDLQALASNHTRFLKAIKAYLQPQPNDAQSERVHEELVKAIEEAEKL